MTDYRSEFDRKNEMLRRNRDAPTDTLDAAVYVHDTMDLAIAAARSLFGDNASAETALAVFDRIEATRDRLIAAKQSQRTHSDEK